MNVRGNVDVIGEMVPPDFLRIFADRNGVAKSAGSGRLELADSLVRADHPLTARVYVNRVWQCDRGEGGVLLGEQSELAPLDRRRVPGGDVVDRDAFVAHHRRLVAGRQKGTAEVFQSAIRHPVVVQHDVPRQIAIRGAVRRDRPAVQPRIEPAGHGEQRIADRFGFKPAGRVVVPQAVAGIARPPVIAHGARLSEGFRKNNPTDQFLRGPAFADELPGQIVEQLRMRRLFSQAPEIVRRSDRTRSHHPSDVKAIEGAIANSETTFRMQTEVPALADVGREPEAIRKLYGLDSKDEYQRYYATQALRARRMVEAGVRFVEITCPSFDGNNSPWDQHGDLKVNHEKNARVTEQSVAALIADLKQRGLLEQTIVLWAGEMGRTPHTPAVTPNCGRDHHVNGFTLCIAGGGFQGGIAHGETDDFGNAVVAQPLSVHDIHATILHQLGIDHTKLTYHHGGRDIRLTDVHGTVQQAMLA